MNLNFRTPFRLSAKASTKNDAKCDNGHNSKTADIVNRRFWINKRKEDRRVLHLAVATTALSAVQFCPASNDKQNA